MHLEQVRVKRVTAGRRWRTAAMGCLAVLLLLGDGCSEPAVKVEGEKPVERQPAEAEPVPVVLPELDDPDRWLIVQKVVSRGEGGWATGSFDRARNKIIIETHAVESFVVDTSRLAINWKKLVILRIDGRNSELRKRDQPALHFLLDHNGRWIVEELGK